MAARGTVRVEHPLELQPGDDVLIRPRPVLTVGRYVEEREARGNDDRPELLGPGRLLLGVVDRAGGTDLLAHPALPLEEKGAVLAVDHRNVGDRLGEGFIYGPPLPEAH